LKQHALGVAHSKRRQEDKVFFDEHGGKVHHAHFLPKFSKCFCLDSRKFGSKTQLVSIG